MRLPDLLAAHTKEHIDRAVEAFITVGKKLGVLGAGATAKA